MFFVAQWVQCCDDDFYLHNIDDFNPCLIFMFKSYFRAKHFYNVVKKYSFNRKLMARENVVTIFNDYDCNVDLARSLADSTDTLLIEDVDYSKFDDWCLDDDEFYKLEFVNYSILLLGSFDVDYCQKMLSKELWSRSEYDIQGSCDILLKFLLEAEESKELDDAED